ncbi:MAG: thiamine diphosphokinase [Bacillota bacterium]|nr:thiamine diphosphokinase [Bacillota bacterium]
MNKRAAIITSYIDTPFDMREASKDMDIIICTDGGYDIAVKYGIKPDCLLGDLDSIKAPVPEDIPVIKFDPVKDYTDLHLAIEETLKLGASHIEIWGGIGGRFDHTMANIQLLTAFYKKCDRLILKDGANEAMILASGVKHTISARDGWYLSLFSLSDTCKPLEILGTKYQVTDFTLTRDYPIAVSNEFASENATIKTDSGTLLLVLSKM